MTARTTRIRIVLLLCLAALVSAGSGCGTQGWRVNDADSCPATASCIVDPSVYAHHATRWHEWPGCECGSFDPTWSPEYPASVLEDQETGLAETELRPPTTPPLTDIEVIPIPEPVPSDDAGDLPEEPASELPGLGFGGGLDDAREDDASAVEPLDMTPPDAELLLDPIE